MPLHEEHCQESLKRYGKRFDELHSWMDEPSSILASSHRKYRHDPHTTPLEAKELFGKNADHACLDHIRLDALTSRRIGIDNRQDPNRSNRQLVKTNPFLIGIFSLICVFIAVFKVSDWGILISIFFLFFAFLCVLIMLGYNNMASQNEIQQLEEEAWLLEKERISREPEDS